jgi:hypothetical protein
MKTTIALIAVCMLCGCSTISYTDGHTTISRSSVGNKLSISKLMIEKDTNGVTKVNMEGYANDQVEGLRAVAEGVAKGMAEAAIKSVKP